MVSRWSRSVATVVCALAIGAAGSCHVPPSGETRSFYMARNTPADASQLGCYNADKSGRMTLFFGAPATVNGIAGATVWGAADRDVNQLTTTIRNVIRGYAYCRQDPSFRLLIGVGTSNSAIDGDSDAWLYYHGGAWATMVRELNSWAATYYPGYAQVAGAWDFEPSWSSFAKAEVWMHGYDDTPGRPALYANSSADGCPTSSATNGPCNNGWSQQLVWHLAWQHDPSLPIPQIYATSGVNAHQWQLIDLWSTVTTGDGMYFYGTLSQYGACQQVGGCTGTDNAPHQAHNFLVYWLATDARTNQPSVDTMTDISWDT